MGSERAGGTTSADRVADVVALFATHRQPMRVTEVARTLGLSKAVVHRILQSLTSRSLLRQVPGRATYVLGPVLTSLAAGSWSPAELRAVSAPILRELRDQTGETTTLSVLVGSERVYVDQHESPHEVKMVVDLGQRLPLHSGASSKAILAFLPEEYADEAVQQLRALRGDLDAEGYRAGLAEIRRHGYARSRNERATGAASVAAPVFGPDHDVLGSISSSGPMFRYDDDDQVSHARLVVAAAQAISVALGARSTPTRDQLPDRRR